VGTEYFGEAPPEVAKRRMKAGHIMRPPRLLDGYTNLYVIPCEGEDCGWFSAPFTLSNDEEREQAELSAWRHRTEPTLLVSGSSDVLYGMRKQTVDDLVAKLRGGQ